MDFPQLSEKVVLITGAGRGIGRAVALAFARQGCRVMVTSFNVENARSTVEEVNRLFWKSRSRAFRLDVTSRHEAAQVVETITQEYGPVDILINNAGVSTMNTVLEMTDQEWDYNLEVNAKGVFIMSQLVARVMVEKGVKGKIINVASQAGRQGFPFFAHYSASKFAVIGFTQAMALEVATHGITVNAVCPGLVRTSMQEREIDWEAKLRGISVEEVKKGYLESIPLGRLQEPEDVADSIVLLASPLADYITGESLQANGGTCMA